MHRTTRRAALGGSFAASLLAAPSAPHAQATWPSRPIRLVVPFAAGGAADSAARAITPKMGERLGGATFVVENRTGASGSVGGGEVARSAPDGYTLLWDASSHLVNPALMRGLPFNYATAFAPVSLVVTFPQVIAVKADFPARTLAEFIAAAKARPGAVSIGTQGNATAGHLAVLQFMRRAGVEVTHVPYRGGADAARDLAAGTLDAVFITMLSAGPIVDSGRARFLAVSTPRRVALRPDVPTFAEAGLPGIEISEWAALFAPAGTPAPILARLHEALTGALGEPEVRARLAQLVAEPVGSPPEEFARFVREGRETMAALVREANIRLD
jgi:tripartite-type tricarboxylate transporter receptor subunit TctC